VSIPTPGDVRKLPVAEFATRIRGGGYEPALAFLRIRGENSWFYIRDWGIVSTWLLRVEGAVSEVAVQSK